MKTLTIDKLTHTERGFIPSTKFKSLVELPYDFHRNNEYRRENEFGAEFNDYWGIWLGENAEESITIRALRKNGNSWITREDYKLLKEFGLI